MKEKLQDALNLVSILMHTLVRLFNAMGIAGGNTEEESSASYYQYLKEVQDGAQAVIDSGIIEKYAE